jgi:hypothetical protein
MLESINGDIVTKVAREDVFNAIIKKLKAERTQKVREGLDTIIDEMEPTEDNRRAFNSSWLGSKLSPWKYPIKHLYDVASEIEGPSADDLEVERRAGLIFGLFIWDCMMRRKEIWAFYDPNLSSTDPNREITGKHYFERGIDTR